MLLRAAFVFCSARTLRFPAGVDLHPQAAEKHCRRRRYFGPRLTSLETLPLHLYNTVIQQLKQQKHELQVQSKAEQHRARTSENFSQAVLSNLSCGVLVFGSTDWSSTANPGRESNSGFRFRLRE